MSLTHFLLIDISFILKIRFLTVLITNLLGSIPIFFGIWLVVSIGVALRRFLMRLSTVGQNLVMKLLDLVDQVILWICLPQVSNIDVLVGVLLLQIYQGCCPEDWPRWNRWCLGFRYWLDPVVVSGWFVTPLTEFPSKEGIWVVFHPGFPSVSCLTQTT